MLFIVLKFQLNRLTYQQKPAVLEKRLLAVTFCIYFTHVLLIGAMQVWNCKCCSDRKKLAQKMWASKFLCEYLLANQHWRNCLAWNQVHKWTATSTKHRQQIFFQETALELEPMSLWSRSPHSTTALFTLSLISAGGSCCYIYQNTQFHCRKFGRRSKGYQKAAGIGEKVQQGFFDMPKIEPPSIERQISALLVASRCQLSKYVCLLDMCSCESAGFDQNTGTYSLNAWPSVPSVGKADKGIVLGQPAGVDPHSEIGRFPCCRLRQDKLAYRHFIADVEKPWVFGAHWWPLL